MNILKLIEPQFNTDPDALSSGKQKPLTTAVESISIQGKKINRYTNEFWTAKQRQASSLQEISYRACFKPQLPGFFIRLFTNENDVVYDPFNGRGTTTLEAALCGRKIIANDINPLSRIFTEGRLFIPNVEDLSNRLDSIPFEKSVKADLDLSMFYHKKTESEIVSIRKYLIKRIKTKKEDGLDQWIRMVATNRLTGHSKGFFSVYTMPPNQAVSQQSQKLINRRLHQQPEYRDTKKIILKKTKDLLRNLTLAQQKNLLSAAKNAKFYSEDARNTKQIKNNTVQLTVTSPPFLDIVDYHQDNWLRGWFNNIDMVGVESKITMSKTVEKWSEVMGTVFEELFRITKTNGWVAFEVGELRNGKIKLDEYVVPLGISAGFTCEGIIINSQIFTKTSNIWGVKNNKHGTNTNRIVLFHK
ncbi:MAG TPA: DNA modification methylase [Bacteroidetes bacterium]|nr:DNA modification methylase [Bacteroidota bacterium]